MVFVEYSEGKQIKNYENYVNNVSRKDLFVANFISKKSFNSDYSFSLDDNNYECQDTFKLVVNVKYVGRLIFCINKENINQSIIDKIGELKDIDSKDRDNALEKINKLLDILFEIDFYFAIFYGCEQGHDIKEYLSSLFQDKEKFLFIIKEKYLDESIITNKTFKQIISYNLHRWLLILTGGVVASFALLFAITNFYNNNSTLSVIFLVIFVGGLIALTIGNYDCFDKGIVITKAKEQSFGLFIDVLALILGCVVFVIVNNFIKTEGVEITVLDISVISVVSIIDYITLLILFCHSKANRRISKSN